MEFYEKLLRKYIKYIMECEGTDSIAMHSSRMIMLDTKFTEKESKVLNDISIELNYPDLK